MTTKTLTNSPTTLTTISKSSFVSLNDSSFDGSAHLFRGYGLTELSEVAFSVDHNKPDIIVFNGGADIGTSIYGEEPIYGYIPRQPSKRDLMEIDIFNKHPDVLKVGICRGAQLLNCLNGGSLWQDVNHHGRDHRMTDVRTGERMVITSTHHQMMRPTKDAYIIGVADEATRKDAEDDHYPFQSFTDDRADTEIVWYGKTRSLCIQGHPEYIPESRFAKYCLELIQHYLNEDR